MITHPEKVLFPDSGITKGELCAYYEAIAPLMLPHISGRPVTMERYPAGIDKKGFIQKDVSKGFPSWLERVEVEKREREGGRDGALPARERRAIAAVARQPELGHAARLDVARAEAAPARPVRLRSRPAGRDDPESCARPRWRCATCSTELGLPTFVKTSGSKGFHIVVPLDGEPDFDDVWRFAHGAGAVLVKRHADMFTQEFIKADRGGRIFVDTGRNGPGATFAAVYAVQTQARRARVRALHLAGGRARRRRPAHVHAANDGRPHA